MRAFRRSFVIVTLAVAAILTLVPALASALAQTVSIPLQSGPTPTVIGSRFLVDINTATPQQLKTLPGMGDAYVRRIIDGRPYTAKNQLVTRGILPQGAYARISGSIIAKRPRK